MGVRASLILGLSLFVGALMVLPGGAFLAAASTGGHASAAIGVRGAAALPPSRAGALPTAPSLGVPASAAANLASLPSHLASVPWIASLSHRGPMTSALTSLPNLGLLQHPLPTNGPVNPFYVAQPAPLGLTDYGLGATPYSYNTSHLMGQVEFAAPPNVTDPASTGVIEPAGQHDGYVGSFYEFGIQLNTVATNMSIPGSDQGFFWTQNVVNFNDSGIHFVDDTFNLTSATQSPFVIQPGTIYSGCNNNSAGVQTILENYGGVFQCVGGTIPLSPASYPVTVQLYNNATVNAQKRTQVAYGYRITEAGLGEVFTGVSDVVVFNSPGAPHHAPANRPGFSIDGFSGAPAGLFRDAEIDLVGDIGGDNAVFRSLMGTVNLYYSNASSGGFRSVPSAYNFGGDTGETSTGIADYWTPSHTLVINQGPAMLYGLWGAPAGVSVASGSIHLAGTISPSFGFVFVGNTHPVRDPWGTSERDNMSWLPTDNSGAFSTYLPPLGKPWTTKYFVQAFAAGYHELNGTPVTGSMTHYTIRMHAAPGWIDAPLYAYSNAQAAALAMSVSGSSSVPYTFNGLLDNMNFSFNHLNDYGYASFVLLVMQGVTNSVWVNNTYQGEDSGAGNFYFLDYAPGAASTGVAMPGPATTSSLPYYTSGINLFDGVNDMVTNQLTAADGYGLQVNLWQDRNAHVSGVDSLYLSSGVWVGDSVHTRVWNVVASTGANCITDMGSLGTWGWDLAANGTLGRSFSVAVVALSSADGTFWNILATDGAFGVDTGADFGAGGAYDPYYYLPGTYGLDLNHIYAYNGSVGANVTLSHDTEIDHVWAWANGAAAVVFDNSAGSSVAWVWAWNHAIGVYLWASTHAMINQIHVRIGSYAVLLFHSHHVSVTHVTARHQSVGVEIFYSSHVSVDGVLAEYYSYGVVLHASHAVTINHVVAKYHSVAVVVV
jgi:hypothetical protein